MTEKELDMIEFQSRGQDLRAIKFLRAKLEADAERLNWLEQNPNHESFPCFDGHWGFPYEVSGAGGQGGGVGFRFFASLREAIDAARGE